jgi:hypothetical protein
MTDLLSRLEDSLPKKFDFYHLGSAELKPLECDFNESCAIAFRLYGELNAVLVVLFEKGLDVDTYSEFGNIIASQLVTHLNSNEAFDIMISPPRVLQTEQLEWMAQQSKPAIRRTYAHLFNNLVIPVETLILPANSEGMGYA